MEEAIKKYKDGDLKFNECLCTAQNKPAEVSHDQLIERKQEQTDSVICVLQSSRTNEQENKEKIKPQPSETQTKPFEKQQDQCLEDNREESSLEEEGNISTKSIRETLEIFSPLNSITGYSNQLKRKATGALVITGSPYKQELEINIEETKKKTISKKLNLKKTKIPQNGNKKKKQEQDENDSWYCKICQEDVKENMIKCSNCEVWVHELCARTTKCYYCDDCQELANSIRSLNEN